MFQLWKPTKIKSYKYSMKNLILQVAVKVPNPPKSSTFSYTEEMYDLSNKKCKEYADRIGADYYCITESTQPHPAFDRMRIFNREFTEYDQILYVDSDYFFHELTPNLFEYTQRQNELGFLVLDNQDQGTPACIENQRRSMTTRYFNSGFFLFKREFIDKFHNTWKDAQLKYLDVALKDQDAINFLIKDHLDDIQILSRHWNGVFAIVEPLFSIHYAGIRKSNWTEEKHNERIKEKKDRIQRMTLEEIEGSYLTTHTERSINASPLF